jgi:phosphatidylserine synthase
VKRYWLPIVIAVVGAFIALTALIKALGGDPKPSLGLLAALILLAAGCVWWAIEVRNPKPVEGEK